MITKGIPNQQMTFEDLRGLRAEGYIRDSSLDQRDGFGPDIQRHSEERFADSYGLILGDRWYTEFVSGRSVTRRFEFQKLLEDARLDLFDVLLVDHTSRFGRNQAECIRHKEVLQRLGKIVVFVSQGIISGSDRDFMSERINETLDEAYSRNLSRYVREGLARKAAYGYAIGRPPLGYRNEKAPSGRGAHPVTDDRTIRVLLAVLKGYASGQHSFRSLAQELNTQGNRTADGRPFTESSISTILNNRFYQGDVVYHRGRQDEEVIQGAHQVPEEVKDLWHLCQEVRRDRSRPGQVGPPSRRHRVYPLTGILVCDGCGQPFHGKVIRKKNRIYPRMVHSWHRCGMRPESVPTTRVEREFADRVLRCITLDDGWRAAVIKAMTNEGPEPDHSADLKRIEAAQTNLRKQHLWGMVDDQGFKSDYQALENQRRALKPKPRLHSTTPNLDLAAALLTDLPALWEHPGVASEQRRELAREVFLEVRLREGELVAVMPRPEYVPIFAYSLWAQQHVARGERSS